MIIIIDNSNICNGLAAVVDRLDERAEHDADVGPVASAPCS